MKIKANYLIIYNSTSYKPPVLKLVRFCKSYFNEDFIDYKVLLFPLYVDREQQSWEAINYATQTFMYMFPTQ